MTDEPGRAERSGSALSWTTGRYRHFVVVTGLPAEEAEPRAVELAVVQQGRFEHPTPLTDADLDDSQSGLVRAGGIPVYWVGPTWTLMTGPAAKLARSDVLLRPGSGPGYGASLEYGATDSPPGAFDIGTWSTTQWEAMLAGPLGPMALPGCAPPRVIALADRRIEVHGMGHAPDCFSSASAYVFFDDVVVSILFPHCFACQPQPSAYSTPAYLEEVARALRRYEAGSR